MDSIYFYIYMYTYSNEEVYVFDTLSMRKIKLQRSKIRSKDKILCMDEKTNANSRAVLYRAGQDTYLTVDMNGLTHMDTLNEILNNSKIYYNIRETDKGFRLKQGRLTSVPDVCMRYYKLSKLNAKLVLMHQYRMSAHIDITQQICLDSIELLSSELNNVMIPDSIDSIKPNLFKDSAESTIETLTIGDRIYEIPTKCMRKIRADTVIFGKNIRKIGSKAFMGARVKHFEFNRRLEEIDSLAFFDCTCKEYVLGGGISKLSMDIFGKTPIELIDLSRTSIRTICNSELSSIEGNNITIKLPMGIKLLNIHSLPEPDKISHIYVPNTDFRILGYEWILEKLSEKFIYGY